MSPDLRLPLHHIDAFTDRLFAGNPAAVCPLPYWLPDATLQAIAAENNLSETAFLVHERNDWHIRWFTPQVEVELCGHATLASAYVYFHHLAHAVYSVTFHSRSGPLTVERDGDWLVMDFPARPPQPAAAPEGLAAALGAVPLEVQGGANWLVLLEDERAVRELRPDFARLRQLEGGGIIATAPGEGCDFVSRFFAPRYGVDEDPVTGSAHCTLAPYWAARLGRNPLFGRQVSARGGEIHCTVRGDRVELRGQAVPYLQGWISLESAGV